MLKILRRGSRWLTALFIIGVGGVFVFFIGLGGPLQGPAPGTVVEVGPYRFGVREFERARALLEDNYREALGDSYDPRALRDTLDQITAGLLVDRAILALEGQELGLAVAKDEIERSVLQAAAFRDAGGRFDRDAFAAWAQYEFGSERFFMTEQRMQLLADKMRWVLASQAHVSEGEARAAVRRQLERVRIASVALDLTQPPDDIEVGDAQVGEFVATREPEAKALYDERSEELNAPEQVRARHILVQLGRDPGEEEAEQARQAAQDALERIRAGEDFAEVAKEVSQDPGSRERGGDLGFFARGQMVKPFEDAAFSREPGTLGELVRSEFGFHVLRVEERRAAEYRSFEQVREELAREILEREATAVRHRATAQKLAAAVRDGGVLEDAAHAEGLTLERSGWLGRRADGFVPGLGASQDLLATAFVLEEGTSSPRIFEVGERLVLVHVLERQQPDPADVEARLEPERKRLLDEKRASQFQTWMEGRRSQLADDGELRVDLAALGR